MKDNIIVISLLIFLHASGAMAQELIPINSWRVHLSYKEVIDLDKLDSRIVAAAKEGIFFYDTDDGSTTTLTSLDGIHPSEITSIGYAKESAMLFVGHSSGVIDIVSRDVKQLHVLREDFRSAKRVNEFFFYNNKAYISTDLGLLIYDINRQLFSATYDGLGSAGDDIRINDAVVFNNKIYAATEEGVIAGSLTGSNLNDFRQWQRFPDLPAGTYTSIVIFDNKIYAAAEGGALYSYNGSQWTSTGLFQSSNINGLSSQNDRLIVTTTTGIYEVVNDQPVVLVGEGLNNPSFAFADENNIWIADNGLILIQGTNREVIKPSGPDVTGVNNLEVIGQKLYALQGRLNNSGGEVFSVFDKGVWYNYSPDASSKDYQIPAGIDGFYDIALFEGDLYLTTFGDGLLKIGLGGTEIITDPFFSVNGSVFLTGIASLGDQLWISNYYNSAGLYNLKGGIFNSFKISSSFLTDIVIAPNNQLILIIDPRYGGGMLIFDPSTGNNYRIDKDNGLPSSHINDVVFDTEGRLWVATNSGIAYFSGMGVLPQPEVQAIRPVFENRFLFRNINVSAMAVDGGGRKWFATTEGVWLFDKEITEQIHYFTQQNSPLLSNDVRDVILLQSTGEVFFATSDGLISFRSDASNPEPPRSDVKVFPNPVVPGFNGTVGITGIAGNANIKITDINGNLVYQTTANGSTASWDLLSMDGQRVASGVYLIFTAKEDGSDTLVGKIAVVR